MAIVNIIGNGFDMSHGYKTSYGDFIKYLVNESINYNQDIRDNLFDVGKLLNEQQSYELIQQKFIDFVNTGQIVFHNRLLRVLMDRFFHAKWIDVEVFYFNYIKKIEENNINFLRKVHLEFDQIKKYLEKYLDGSIKGDVFLDDYLNYFANRKHKDYLFLNFNYTNTIERYLKKLRDNYVDFNFENIHIHGKLLDVENEIVFGYGNENSDYRNLLEYDNEFTRFHKSHIYPKKDNKQRLLNFLRSYNDIQVNFFGHSCGESDRVLLRQIIESDNVKRVKVFYHKHKSGDNFQDITTNLIKAVSSSSFIDNKLDSMPSCYEMPQFLS